MYLRGDDAIRANNINQFIRNYVHVIEESFDRCEECKGTGLYGFRYHEQGASWDGVSYCDKCDGTGYINWVKSDLFMVCNNCSGLGCKKCDHKGVVDWIQGMRMGISK